MFTTDLTKCPKNSLQNVDPSWSIDLPREWAGAWVLFADVDDDSQQELITARVHDQHDIHYTVSVAAFKLNGQNIWTWGKPEKGCGTIHSDVACQVADFDGSGDLKVAICTEDHFIILDARNGQEISKFPIPEHASDSIFLTDLTGDGNLDVIIKDRYWNLYAYQMNGTPLWHIHLPGGTRTCHHPIRVNMGTHQADRLILGSSCYSLSGKMLWDMRGQGLDDVIDLGHLDCARVIDSERKDLLMSLCVGQALCRVGIDGNIQWVNRDLHYESLHGLSVAGMNQIIVDIDHCAPGESELQVLDGNGAVLGKFRSKRARSHREITWDARNSQKLVLAEDRCVVETEHGNILAYLSTPLPSDKPFDQTSRSTEHAKLGAFLCKVFASDVDGDGHDEIIITTNPGGVVWIFKTPLSQGDTSDSKTQLAIPAKTNRTLY